MALLSLLFVLVQSLIQYPQPAGDGLDEATHRRMQERQELLDREMARLLQELQQGPAEQQDEDWGALLFGALQQWPFWVLAAVLLLLGLWFSHRRRSREAKSSGKDQSSCMTSGDEREKEQEEDIVGSKEDGENVDVQVEQDREVGKKEEGDGNEEKTSDANMKAGKSDDIKEGQYNVDGKEENANVKVEESSDASEQSSSDWTGQEGSRDSGNAVEHSGFLQLRKKTDSLELKNAMMETKMRMLCCQYEGRKYEDGNGEERGSVASAEEGGDEANEGESNNVKVKENRHSSEHRSSDWNRKDEEHSHANVRGKNNEDGKEEEGENVAISEKEGRAAGKHEGSRGGIEDKEDARDTGKNQGILLMDRIKWPVEDLERGCSVTAELMESFTRVFVDRVSNSFYPVPQEAIGVGSAFEGWSPREQDVVYRVLVPLNPPPGHAFHLELNSAGQMAARTFRVRVELLCTCKREQLGKKPLCFLHHSRKKLWRKQKRSLLETLCTGSYLDVEKTSHWFYRLVRSSWLRVPQSYSWHLVFQPCSRSCQFRLSRGEKSLTVEMLFGVRQGDSDIFVVSRDTEAQKGGSSVFVSSPPAKADFIASTAWPETYAVAEAKFFQHIARQVPCESLHLKCLQVFTCILRGTGFSSSTWKTVVMHVLTTVPLSRWRRREFARRLWDIMAYLRRCLQLKRLEHFVLGNKRLPAEISLPPAVRAVEPLNLFEHLARDPAAHRQAMHAYGQLRFRLWMLLSSR